MLNSKLIPSESLTYYDEAGREAKDTFPVAQILGVEPVAVSAFLKTNVFQVAIYLFCH